MPSEGYKSEESQLNTLEWRLHNWTQLPSGPDPLWPFLHVHSYFREAKKNRCKGRKIKMTFVPHALSSACLRAWPCGWHIVGLNKCLLNRTELGWRSVCKASLHLYLKKGHSPALIPLSTHWTASLVQFNKKRCTLNVLRPTARLKRSPKCDLWDGPAVPETRASRPSDNGRARLRALLPGLQPHYHFTCPCLVFITPHAGEGSIKSRGQELSCQGSQTSKWTILRNRSSLDFIT